MGIFTPQYNMKRTVGVIHWLNRKRIHSLFSALVHRILTNFARILYDFDFAWCFFPFPFSIKKLAWVLTVFMVRLWQCKTVFRLYNNSVTEILVLYQEKCRHWDGLTMIDAQKTYAICQNMWMWKCQLFSPHANTYTVII